MAFGVKTGHNCGARCTCPNRNQMKFARRASSLAKLVCFDRETQL